MKGKTLNGNGDLVAGSSVLYQGSSWTVISIENDIFLTLEKDGFIKEGILLGDVKVI